MDTKIMINAASFKFLYRVQENIRSLEVTIYDWPLSFFMEEC